MLSHHEFAALALVNGSCEPTELDCADAEALLAHELATLESLGTNRREPRLTAEVHAYLKVPGNVRA